MTSERLPSVLVLGGGPDAEHAVSLESAASVAAALRKAGHEVHSVTIQSLTPSELEELPGEVIFPVLHGRWGEGGGLQRLLEATARPFVGCGALAGGLAMDKMATKLLASMAGVPTAEACLVRPEQGWLPLRPPVVIKPVLEGSSVGLHVCQSESEADAALVTIDPACGPWMAERFIRGRELTVGLLASEQGELESLPIVEIVSASSTYDYAAKYERDDTRYVVAPEFAPGVEAMARERALRIAAALGVRHLARVDFLLDAESALWLLEVNTMPGFTSHSLLPMAASAAGLTLPEVVSRLAMQALLSRHEDSVSMQVRGRV